METVDAHRPRAKAEQKAAEFNGWNLDNNIFEPLLRGLWRVEVTMRSERCCVTGHR